MFLVKHTLYRPHRVRNRLVLCMLSNCRKVRTCHKIWCKSRSKQWWSEALSGIYGDGWWRENLRMSRETYMFLCDELRPHIQGRSQG